MARSLNLLARSVLVGTAVLVLAGCGSTPTATQNCADGICTIVLDGDGASATVREGGGSVELAGTEDRVARLKVNGTEGPITLGVPVGFGANGTITLTAIDGDRVTLKVDRTTAPEDAAEQRENEATPRPAFGQSGRKGG